MEKNPKKPLEDLDSDLPGNYPPSEDIYAKSLKVGDIDSEDGVSLKTPAVVDLELEIENDVITQMLDDLPDGEDLDVPGSELDDEAEIAGNEDEENNYYSLGGDNHDD